MNNEKNLNKILKIGILQAKVDVNIAWKDNQGNIQQNLNNTSEKYLIEQFKRAFKYFKNDNNHADIILLSEYTIPLSYISELENYAKSLNSVIIGGLDLLVDSKKNVLNKGVIIIPNNWESGQESKYTNISYFGKVYLTKVERNWFNTLKKNQLITGDFVPTEELIIVNTGKFGNIGIVICADIYDIERIAKYKGIIQHLFVIAYNRDVRTFKVHAESISKMLMCNVVICNNGFYGDSLAFSPYKENYKKLVYEVSGCNIFNAQKIELTCSDLYELQKKISICPGLDDKEFSVAPGYKIANISLTEATTYIKEKHI